MKFELDQRSVDAGNTSNKFVGIRLYPETIKEVEDLICAENQAKEYQLQAICCGKLNWLFSPKADDENQTQKNVT